MRRRLFLALCLGVILVGCAASPKNKAADWAKRFPLEIGAWETEAEDRVELLPENQSNYGQVTLPYVGADDVTANLQITVFGTENAADVALMEAMRQWELNGARFERERIRTASFDMATLPGGRVIYHQVDDTVLMLSVVAPDPTTALPEEDITLFLETILAVVDNRD